MTQSRQRAVAEFKRTMKWIVAIAVVMVGGSLVFIDTQSELTLHMVVATILGVFFAVLLGTGLFALAFFSNKSGHDDVVTDSTRRGDERARHDDTPR
jgi:uncharacterized membrane protein YbjE (DUF340 family)